MEQFPSGARGLMLVDGSTLVEHNDVAEYDTKLRRDIQYIIHDRLETYDEIQKVESVKMLNEVDERIEAAKKTLRAEIDKVVNVDLVELDL